MIFEKILINKSYWWVRHLLFWTAMYLDQIVGTFYYPDDLLFTDFLSSIFLDMVLVYSNIYILIPQFLIRKKYFFYILLTLISTAIVIGLNFYSLLQEIPIEELDVFYTIFDTTFFTVGILAVAIAIKLTRYFIERQQKVNELRESQLTSELTYLKQQTNPHFLFNTLNSIYVLAKQKRDNTPNAIMLLADLMRYQTYEATNEKVALDKEIEFIRNYLELEKIRRDKLEVQISVEKSSNGEIIEPLIFLPFVENAVKHSMSTDDNEETIDITIQSNPDQIKLEISNSKGTNQLAKLSENSGFGLDNIKKRLELLYPNRHTIEISNQATKFDVKLCLKK